MCVFVAAIMFFTEPLPSNNKEIYIPTYDTQAVEIGSGVMIYIPRFIKIDSAIQKLIGGMHKYTDSMEIA
jgi:hypothetical protein